MDGEVFCTGLRPAMLRRSTRHWRMRMRSASRRSKLLIAVGLSTFVVATLFGYRRVQAHRLYAAASAGNITVVHDILQGYFVPINGYTTVGLQSGAPAILVEVPLIGAAKSGSTDVMKLLIENGSDPEAVNEWNETALSVASRAGQTESIVCLLEQGANVNHVCGNGRTPLFWAVGYASPEAIEALLKSGARSGVDKHGLSILAMLKHRVEPDRSKIETLLFNK